MCVNVDSVSEPNQIANYHSIISTTDYTCCNWRQLRPIFWNKLQQPSPTTNKIKFKLLGAIAAHYELNIEAQTSPWWFHFSYISFHRLLQVLWPVIDFDLSQNVGTGPQMRSLDENLCLNSIGYGFWGRERLYVMCMGNEILSGWCSGSLHYALFWSCK